MTDEEFVEQLEEYFKSHARQFTPGNNWVLGPTNGTARYIARWVTEFLKEKNIKY